MPTFNKIIKVKNLEEAYLLNQKRQNIIIGGYMWLKMSHRTFDSGIDLSELHLDTIDESEDYFSIGSMCTLRSLETSLSINRYFNNTFSRALNSIVGTQFRNGATVGGTLYGRYGFSDLLTCLMALDTYVILHHQGRLPLSDFSSLKFDNDILIKTIIRKDASHLSYQSHHNSKTDFPVITVAVSKTAAFYRISVGARPMRASLFKIDDPFKSNEPSRLDLDNFSNWIADQFTYANNLRASAEYRKHLASIYIRRAIEEILYLERKI